MKKFFLLSFILVLTICVSASAQITPLGTIGTNNSKTSGTTLVITTTTTVSSGNTIIVGYASDGSQTLTPVTVTDQVGNTYNQVNEAVSYAHGRTYIFAAYNVIALPSGNTITITANASVTARTAVATAFSGLTSDPLDQELAYPLLADQLAPSGTAPSVGPTGTTTQADELLIGVIGTEGPVGDNPGTWDNSFSAGPRDGTTGGTGSTNMTVSLGYKIVSATGTYTASKTGITTSNWMAAIGTFKAAPSGPTHDLTMAVSPSSGGTTDPSVGVSTYPENDVVNITATPASGFNFVNWTGDVDNVNSASTTVTMDADQTVTANFLDVEAPVITLLGDADVTIYQGDSYTDAGATANDNADGDITGSIVVGGDVVDVNTIDDYIITYNVQDAAGNNATQVTRTVHVIALPPLGIDGAVSSNTADGVSSINISHTTGTGTDRLMLVGISANSYNSAQTISSVVFNPGNLTLDEVGTIENESGRLSAIYGLVNPPSGVSGTVTVTFSGSVAYGIVAGVVNFYGVDQTTPWGSFVSAVGQSTDQSVDLTGLNGDEIIFDNVFIGAATIPTITVGADQAEQWNTSSDRAGGSASIEQATSSAVTMSWSTGATSVYWAIGAVPINPAGPDVTNPMVTIDQASGQDDPTNASTINFTVVFNEPVTGFETGDVTIGGTANPTTGTVTEIAPNDGTTYNVAVSGMTGPGTVTASIAASVAQDAATNPNDASTSTDNEVTYDVTAPTVTIDQAGAQADPTSTSPINFTVVFSEPVTGFETGDVTVGGTANPTTDNVTEIAPNDGTTYNVEVSGMTGSGTVTASIASFVATDLAGNSNDASTSTDNEVSYLNTGGFVSLDGDSHSNTADANSTSISISHTTGTGSKRLMLVGISWNSGSTEREIDSVVFIYGGGPTRLDLALVHNEQYGSSPRNSAIYSLLNPPSGESGTVTVYFNGGVSNGIVAGAANFSGVDQTTPLGTPDGTSMGSDDTPTITLNSLNGNEMVFDNVFSGTSGSYTITKGVDQTEQWNQDISNTIGSASIQQATGSSVTMSWTVSSNTIWVISAVPINPAPPTLKVQAKVFLQGPYSGSGSMSTALNPDIPLNDPYSQGESVGSIPSGDIVDWVLVELRVGTAAATSAGMRAAFLKNDGTVVDLDGSSPVEFDGISSGNYYIVIKHRNHLAVMSHDPVALPNVSAYNFTTGSGQYYGTTNGANELETGIWGMISGDGDGNGQVQNDDNESVWKPDNGLSGYKNSDFNLNGQVQNDDNEEHWKPNNGKGTQVPPELP